MKRQNVDRGMILAVALIVFIPAAVWSQSAEAERKAIAAVAERFSAAYVRGDVNTMMDCYTHDASIFPNGTDIISHRDSIRRYWTLPGNVKVTHHMSTPIEITVVDKTAYDFGYYEGATSRDGVEPVAFRGKYVIVWVKEDDEQWRMKLDIWNSVKR